MRAQPCRVQTTVITVSHPFVPSDPFSKSCHSFVFYMKLADQLTIKQLQWCMNIPPTTLFPLQSFTCLSFTRTPSDHCSSLPSQCPAISRLPTLHAVGCLWCGEKSYRRDQWHARVSSCRVSTDLVYVFKNLKTFGYGTSAPARAGTTEGHWLRNITSLE